MGGEAGPGARHRGRLGPSAAVRLSPADRSYMRLTEKEDETLPIDVSGAAAVVWGREGMRRLGPSCPRPTEPGCPRQSQHRAGPGLQPLPQHHPGTSRPKPRARLLPHSLQHKHPPPSGFCCLTFVYPAWLCARLSPARPASARVSCFLFVFFFFFFIWWWFNSTSIIIYHVFA